MSRDFDRVGWLRPENDQWCVDTVEGTFILAGDEVPSDGRRLARVRGTERDGNVVDVASIDLAPAADRLPLMVARARRLHLAARLRQRAIEWLGERGFDFVTLPTVWYRTEEYGAPEFALSHPSHVADDLRLLQSPELPLLTALAEGMGPCYTFGRCYRHELDHDPSRSSSYLMEFEQFVLASSFSSLEEMMAVAEQLVAALASEVGVLVEESDFARFGRTARTVRRPDVPHFDDMVFLTVPAPGTSGSDQSLPSILEETSAKIWRLDADGSYTPVESAAALRAGDRVALHVEEDRRHVLEQVVLDLRRSSVEADSVAQRQWNPTWSMLPTLAWRPGEESDSSLPVRAFTSAPVTAPDDGDDLIADAELHLGGTEVVHVREYADVLTVISQADKHGAPGIYDYLADRAEVAPPGMVGAFIGWERLTGVLLGAAGADEMLLFPRRGDGNLAETSLRA